MEAISELGRDPDPFLPSYFAELDVGRLRQCPALKLAGMGRILTGKPDQFDGKNHGFL
jgi:hypothetical protein